MVDDVLGGIFGGLFGSGSSGISKAAAQCFGQGAANTIRSLLTPLIGAISTFGYVQQFNLQQDALALAERGVVIAERTIELSERNYNEIAIPIFQRFRDYFDDCVPDMKNVQRAFIDKSMACEEYTADFDGQEGRARGQVAPQFDAARKQVRRSRGKGSIGYVKDQDIRISIAQAVATSNAVNLAYRFEDNRKIVLDQQCFERCQAGAAMASSITAQAFNGLNGAASVVNSALSQVQGATGNLIAQLNETAQSVQNNADFFGSIANGGFRFLGANTFQGPQSNGVIGSPFGFGGGGGGFGLGSFGIGGVGINGGIFGGGSGIF